jgi:hypothetical protein
MSHGKQPMLSFSCNNRSILTCQKKKNRSIFPATIANTLFCCAVSAVFSAKE